MRVATWVLARLVGTPAAHAIAGDLAESIPVHGWRRRFEAWSIVFRLGSSRLRPRRKDARRPAGHGYAPRPAQGGGGLRGDVRFALRVFRAHPASTAIAVLSLGLGIGANAAIFSLLDNLLLRPIPVPRPAELVTTPTVFSHPDYLDLAEASSDELTGLAAWSATSRPYNLATGAGAWSMLAELTTGNYFDVLEVPAAAGRLLSDEDETQERAVAVISNRLWQTAFGSDPEIAGTEARVNGVPVVIVGVTSGDFRGTRVNRAVDLWLPLSLHPQLATGSRARLSFDSRGTQWLRILGRSRPDSGLPQARAALLAGAQQILATGPSPYLDDFAEVQAAEAAAVPRADEVSRFLTLMLTMVGAALLVACANVANVLLTRTAERRRELGLRMALGAPRRRLVRQLLTESLLLGAAGGLLALLFARWTLASVRLLEIPGRILLADVPLHLNTTTLIFTSLAALICTIAFGIGPAIVGTRPDAARLSHGSTTNRRGWTGPTALASVQVALTLALVFSGGLFVRSLGTALDVELGFDSRDVFVSDLDLGVAGYDAASAAEFRRTALASIESIPEVESAAWGLFVPVQRGMRMEAFRVVGHELRDEDPTDVALNYVSPGYFETLGIRLLAGRPFGEVDVDGSSPTVIVNETLASHFWPAGGAVGNRLNFPGPEGILELEIVGVAADTKRRGLREEPSPYIYLPIDQWTWLVGADQVRLAWRETAGTGATIDTVRARIAALDPGLPMPGLRSLDAQIFDQAMPQRVGATLLGMFAAMALLLAAVGVYGVIAAAMASRVREIGIRRAVGARASDVATLTVRRGLLPVIIGVPLGWVLALGASRLIESFLPGLSPTDPTTMAAATVVVVLAATVACLPPALRVARRDPALVLRAD